MGSVWRKVVFATGARVYAVAAMLVTLVATSRWLGPDGRGIVATTVAWATVLGTALHLSLGQVSLNDLAGRGEDQGRLATVLAALRRAALAATLVAWGAVLVLRATGSPWLADLPTPAVVAIALLVPFVVWEHFGSFLLMSRGRLSAYNRAQVAGRSAEVLVVGVGVGALGFGVEGALVGAVLAQGIVACFGLRSLHASVAGTMPTEAPGSALRALARRGVRLHPNAIGYLLFSSMDVVLVQRFLGAGPTGHYSLAVQITNALLIVPVAAGQVLFERVSQAGPDEAWGANRRVLAVAVAGMVLLTAVVWIVAPIVVPLVVGPRFEPTVPLLRLLLLTSAARTVSALMAPQWIARGLFGTASAVTMLVGLVTLAVDLVALPRIGVRGAAYGAIAGYTVGLACNVWLIVHVERRYRSRRAPAVDGFPAVAVGR